MTDPQQREEVLTLAVRAVEESITTARQSVRLAAAVEQLQACRRCGRSEGLGHPKLFGELAVLGCDCNYQHILQVPR